MEPANVDICQPFIPCLGVAEAPPNGRGALVFAPTAPQSRYRADLGNKEEGIGKRFGGQAADTGRVRKVTNTDQPGAYCQRRLAAAGHISNPSSSGRNRGQTFSEEVMTAAASLVPISTDWERVLP